MLAQSLKTLAILALFNSKRAHAQSVDPQLRTNPNAQGATNAVTPSTGPNG
jgi:hypothetical protein